MCVDSPGMGEKQIEFAKKPNCPKSLLLNKLSLAFREDVCSNERCFLIADDFARKVKVMLVTCLQ